ncbi:MAG: hypothetical protein U0234_10980 [Sandaracinus sp.]
MANPSTKPRATPIDTASLIDLLRAQTASEADMARIESAVLRSAAAARRRRAVLLAVAVLVSVAAAALWRLR